MQHDDAIRIAKEWIDQIIRHDKGFNSAGTDPKKAAEEQAEYIKTLFEKLVEFLKDSNMV